MKRYVAERAATTALRAGTPNKRMKPSEGMNVDDLTGRELDTLVAERLFELEVEARINTQTGEIEVVCRAPGKQWLGLALYSDTLSASITVEVELQVRGWRRKALLQGDSRVILEHADGRTIEASGPPYKALCRAALKAVQAER